MKIEEFKDIKIAYMRRVGKYGLENKHLIGYAYTIHTINQNNSDIHVEVITTL